MSQNLFDQFTQTIREPSKTLIEVDGGRAWTYAEVVDLSGRLANVLTARGVIPGDRVAVQVEKTAEALILYLAVVRAGAAYLPLNTAYTLSELDYFIGDAEPRIVVCDPAKREGIADICDRYGVAALETLDAKGGGSLMDAAMTASPQFETVPRKGDDLASILYTSGTTGRSKGAMLSHDNLVSNARSLVAGWRFTPSDVLIHALPIFHIHGLFVATNTILFAGASMIFQPKFDADAVLAAMPRATTLMGVPTFYTRLLDHPGLNQHMARDMRLFVSGSAPLLAETHRAWKEATGHAILERYGMTETNMNTSNPYDGERIAGTVGLPLPGVELRIADPDSGKPVPKGEIGMIEIRGPNVFKGYWRMPEKTAAEFRPDGYFITGDLGQVGDTGYVSIVGRGKDLVISGGFNVYPKEVEDAIDALPGVMESAVIGVPHRDFGEGVVAVVTAQKNASLEEKAIQTALREKLAAFKLPKRVIVVDELPRNTMGKVQKNLLRDRFKDLFGA